MFPWLQYSTKHLGIGSGYVWQLSVRGIKFDGNNNISEKLGINQSIRKLARSKRCLLPALSSTFVLCEVTTEFFFFDKASSEFVFGSSDVLLETNPMPLATISI